MESKAPDKAVNKSDKRVRLPKIALLDWKVRQCPSTRQPHVSGRVEGLAELLEDCSIERKVLLQPPGAQDTVRSTSETSENASSWRIFLRPCSSKRFPSSSCAFMLSLSSPSVETLSISEGGCLQQAIKACCEVVDKGTCLENAAKVAVKRGCT